MKTLDTPLFRGSVSKKATARFVVVAAITTSVIVACTEEATKLDSLQLVSAEVQSLSIEIDYQPGAAPTFWSENLQDNPWEVFRRNAEALFEAHPRQLRIPTSGTGLEILETVQDKTFNAQSITEIAAAHRDSENTATHRSFYYLYLNGYYADEAKPSGYDTVLGVSISGAGIIALFQPVIQAFSPADLVETIAVIHEFGHAIGLVNAGLPLASLHHDESHGAHCNNPKCIMYYLFEDGRSVGDLFESMSFIENRILFGQECLSDAHTAAQ